MDDASGWLSMFIILVFLIFLILTALAIVAVLLSIVFIGKALISFGRPMRPIRTSIWWTLGVYIICCVLLIVLWCYTFSADLDQSQRYLLYHTDHKAILEAGRATISDTNLYPAEYIEIGSLPKVFADMKPSYATFNGDRKSLWIEFGGGHFHYGFTIYAEGEKGIGTKELIPGLWYYAENNEIVPDTKGSALEDRIRVHRVGTPP